MIHPGVNVNQLFVSFAFSEALHLYKTEKSIFVYSVYYFRITKPELEKMVSSCKPSFKKAVHSNAGTRIAGGRHFV